MSNMGLDLALKKLGIKQVKTKVGDRYVLENMRKNGYNIGGEQSGHIIFREYMPTGDGELSAIQLMRVMRALKQIPNVTDVRRKFESSF